MASASETNNQRAKIKAVYTGPKWAKKVNLMNADQVFAIYSRLVEQGKIKI